MQESISITSSVEPITILLLTVVSVFLISEYWKNRLLPPGPYGLPYFGYTFFLDRSRMSQQCSELCQRYKSDILSLRTLGVHYVILNSYSAMKEVYQKRADAADRMDFSLFRTIDPHYTGISDSNGRQWKEIRRFSISTLKDLGMGRAGAEEMIQTEAEILTYMIKKHDGEAFNPQSDINIAVSNIICGMVFGQRFDYDNKNFLNVLEGMNNLLYGFNSVTLLRYKLIRDYILKDLYQGMARDYNNFEQFVQKRIEEHKRDYTGQTTDMIYYYLKEMEQGRDPEIFDEKMLVSVITDLFSAGTITTYSTLRWCLLAMAAYPDVQKRVQEELDHVIGERTPSMNDKPQTPYTDAVLSEVQRHFTLVPLCSGHSNLAGDVTMNGYKIPQNSFIAANLDAIHHDKNFWKNPNQFDPENFLNDGKVINLERLVPFAIGRRACAGEALARMELYVFFVSLVKNFNIKLETDDTVADLDGYQIGLYVPKPFKLRMKQRL